MSEQNDTCDTDNTFLHFYQDRNYNRNQPTYCQDPTSIYHDTRYVWCYTCDKIFCSECSYKHLLDNQLDHNKNIKFSSKEVLDNQFRVDFKRLNDLGEKIKSDYESNKNSTIQSYNALNELYTKSNDLFDKLIKALTEYREKIKNAILNLGGHIRNIEEMNSKRKSVKDAYNNIYEQFNKVNEQFGKLDQILPNQIKIYHHELAKANNNFTNLNKHLMENSLKNNVSNVDWSISYGKVKNNLNDVIFIVNESLGKIKNLIRALGL